MMTNDEKAVTISHIGERRTTVPPTIDVITDKSTLRRLSKDSL